MEKQAAGGFKVKSGIKSGEPGLEDVFECAARCGDDLCKAVAEYLRPRFVKKRTGQIGDSPADV